MPGAREFYPHPSKFEPTCMVQVILANTSTCIDLSLRVEDAESLMNEWLNKSRNPGRVDDSLRAYARRNGARVAIRWDQVAGLTVGQPVAPESEPASR